jgi:hypothetical protein
MGPKLLHVRLAKFQNNNKSERRVVINGND